MLNCVIVGLGGFIGAVLRYLIGFIPIKNPDSFPINTFIINILGALIIGIIAFTAAKNQNLDAKLILFLKVGICGGFTTFFIFSPHAQIKRAVFLFVRKQSIIQARRKI